MAENNQLTTPIGKLDYEAGETKELRIPRSHYLQHLNILVDWDVTVNTADTPQVENGILELVDSVELVYDGSTTLKNTSMATSHFLDWYQRGTRPVFDGLDLSTASQQTGTLQTYVDAKVHPDVITGLFPAFATSDFRLRVKWGTDASIADDVTVNDATMRVEAARRRRDTVKEGYINQYKAYKEVETTTPITQSGKTVIELPRGNRYYGLAVQVLDGGDPDEDLVDSVALEEEGTITHRESTFDAVKAQDKLDYGLETLAPAFGVLNYGIDGSLTDTVDSSMLDQYELTVDTDGVVPTDPAKVKVMRMEVVE
jgi:hypothetical protein